MAEVLVVFDTPIWKADRQAYTAQVCGRSLRKGPWEGWIEFFPVDIGPPIRTSRETVQPSHSDLTYWAQGLTLVYLEGALDRALALLKPRHRRTKMPAAPAFAGPASLLSKADPGQGREINP
jgi:hypothetical protein